jgi:hypothetical protein
MKSKCHQLVHNELTFLLGTTTMVQIGGNASKFHLVMVVRGDIIHMELVSE